jgi:hypothetical protein
MVSSFRGQHHAPTPAPPVSIPPHNLLDVRGNLRLCRCQAQEQIISSTQQQPSLDCVMQPARHRDQPLRVREMHNTRHARKRVGGEGRAGIMCSNLKPQIAAMTRLTRIDRHLLCTPMSISTSNSMSTSMSMPMLMSVHVNVNANVHVYTNTSLNINVLVNINVDVIDNLAVYQLTVRLALKSYRGLHELWSQGIDEGGVGDH